MRLPLERVGARKTALFRFWLAAPFVVSCAVAAAPVAPRAPETRTREVDASAPVVLREGTCSIAVGAIVEFAVYRGGAPVPGRDLSDPHGEDHFDAHGRCVLDVRVGSASRFYLHYVSGAWMQGPKPSAEECLGDRARIADHLMIMTDHCSDPDGRGTLTRR